MKKILLTAAVVTALWACNDNPGNNNNAGNTTSPNGSNALRGDSTVTKRSGDTTPTTNNNAYNKDSMTGSGTMTDSSGRHSGMNRSTPNKSTMKQK